jgi:hypothetical protein
MLGPTSLLLPQARQHRYTPPTPSRNWHHQHPCCDQHWLAAEAPALALRDWAWPFLPRPTPRPSARSPPHQGRLCQPCTWPRQWAARRPLTSSHPGLRAAYNPCSRPAPAARVVLLIRGRAVLGRWTVGQATPRRLGLSFPPCPWPPNSESTSPGHTARQSPDPLPAPCTRSGAKAVSLWRETAASRVSRRLISSLLRRPELPTVKSSTLKVGESPAKRRELPSWATWERVLAVPSLSASSRAARQSLP